MEQAHPAASRRLGQADGVVRAAMPEKDKPGEFGGQQLGIVDQ